MPTALSDASATLPGQVADEITPSDHGVMATGFAGTLLLGAMRENLPPPISLSIVYEPVESGWVQARIEGIPEVITAGRSKAEARELVLDALREYLASTRVNGEAVDREQVDLTIV
jgi:hypothetical protein